MELNDEPHDDQVGEEDILCVEVYIQVLEEDNPHEEVGIQHVEEGIHLEAHTLVWVSGYQYDGG